MFFCACTPKAPSANLYLASSLLPLKESIEQAASKKALALNLIFQSSSLIAQQIAAGAPCDAVIVADDRWRDYLLKENLVDGDAQVVAQNSLFIATSNARATASDVKGALGSVGERIIIADPAFVPLGAYTKEALSNLGLFDEREKHFIRAHSAQNAAMLLLQGVAKVAVLYGSDIDNQNIYRLFAIDQTLHKPITYAFLQCKRANKNHARVLQDLFLSPSFKEILKQKGF